MSTPHDQSLVLTELGVAPYDMEMTHNLQSSMYQKKDTLQPSKCVLTSELSFLTTVSSVMTKMGTSTFPARKSLSLSFTSTGAHHQVAQEEF